MERSTLYDEKRTLVEIVKTQRADLENRNSTLIEIQKFLRDFSNTHPLAVIRIVRDQVTDIILKGEENGPSNADRSRNKGT